MRTTGQPPQQASLWLQIQSVVVHAGTAITQERTQVCNIRTSGKAKGDPPRQGATVAIDWDGYTIGYYGRPFQARNKVSIAWVMCDGRCLLGLRKDARHLCAQAKGGSFGQGADRELFRFTLGDQTAIPAIEEAVITMKPGGIRRLIVPVRAWLSG